MKDIRKVMAELPRCKTCERVRYPEKYCINCQFNPNWQDNYKIDQNIKNVLEKIDEKTKN